jgi:hypothetical protein
MHRFEGGKTMYLNRLRSGAVVGAEGHGDNLVVENHCRLWEHWAKVLNSH